MPSSYNGIFFSCNKTFFFLFASSSAKKNSIYVYMHIYVSVLRLKGLGLFHLQGRLLNKRRKSVTTVCLFIVSGTVGSSPAESVVTKGESNQSGESLLPETAQLLSSLSSLQPKIFAQLQVQSSCLQNVRSSVLGVLKAS